MTSVDIAVPVVTSAAETFMRRMVRLGGHGGFRLEVSPGGCSGLKATFSVEKAPHPGDTALDVRGLPVYLPAASLQLLSGVTIDFKDTATETGFAFIDPNAEGCGCSTGAPKKLQLGRL